MQSWKAFIWGFPKMVVPPFHTPKWWSFLVGKPSWLLGKPTILGNNHFWRNHNFCRPAFAAVFLYLISAGESAGESTHWFRTKDQKGDNGAFWPKERPNNPWHSRCGLEPTPKRQPCHYYFQSDVFDHVFSCCFVACFCCAARRGADAVRANKETATLLDDAPPPEAGNRDVEERTEPVGGAPATRAREAKESHKAACNLIWRIRCLLDCSHQQPGGCLVWLS